MKTFTLFCAALALAVSALASARAASVGEAAPAFELPDQYGQTHRLDEFAGKWLVVFFYPRADTPGCTTEACNFRDNIYAIRAAGAEVVGISVDPVAEQRKFSDKYKLPFTILSDTAGSTCGDYGVLRKIGEVEIANRESFLIDPDGIVVKHYESVHPETHTQEVIADLERLRSQREPG